MFLYLKRCIIFYIFVLTTCFLQGCLLYLFFAPKMDADRLPTSEELRPKRELYVAQCSRCHPLIAPSYFAKNADIDEILLHYREQKILTVEEADTISRYIKQITASSYE